MKNEEKKREKREKSGEVEVQKGWPSVT